MRRTDYTDICYGELISSTLMRQQTLQKAGMRQEPLMGCFNTRRCVYAESAIERPIPKSGMPSGTSKPLEPPLKPKGPLHVPPKLKITPAKRKAEPEKKELSHVPAETILAVNDGDEVAIARLILQGIEQEDLKRMINPDDGTEKR